MRHLLTACLVLLLVLPFSVAKAQLSKAEIKIYKKSQRKYKKEKYKEAIDLFEPVVMQHKDDARLWNVLISYYEARYYSSSLINSRVRITVEGSDDQEAANELAALLNMAFSAPKDEYYDIMRKATLHCSGLSNTSIKLRAHYVDKRYPVDEKVGEAAWKKYSQGEQFFRAGDYKKAAKHYKQAFEVNRKFYKARLYYGDCFYMMGDYHNAAPIFKELALEYPNLIEPQKFYIDALMGLKEYETAYAACVDALMIFPNEDLFDRMQKICIELKRDFTRYWVSRPYDINQVGVEDTSTWDDDNWKYYKEAQELIEPYCDSLGVIVKQNELTKYKYLEAFCWQYMLEKAGKRAEFRFARKMHEQGKLDCYVMICVNHVDFYDQYHHLVNSQRERVRKFISEDLE